MKKVLRGWKEIEDFLGLSRKTIVAHGYPVRKTGSRKSQTFAFIDDLQQHMRRIKIEEKDDVP